MTPEQEKTHNEEMIKAVDEANATESGKEKTNVSLPSETESKVDNKEPELPEGFESVEELITFVNALEDDSEEDEDSEEDKDSEEDDEWRKRAEEAESALVEKAAYEAVGGPEQYAELAKWATENLEESDQAFYNSVMEQGSPEQVAFAVRAVSSVMKLQSIENFGHQGEINQGSNSNNATSGYESVAQMQADMNDPRYGTDPAFRSEVEAKLRITTAF